MNYIRDSDNGQINDTVNHPSHYTNNGIECINEMIAVFGKENTAIFCILNVWKYRKRAFYKNGEEDLQKADWYMKKYCELTENGLYTKTVQRIFERGVIE